jgi:ElaB/YqjD/DUF883 family membrane-anchored ribosome-binding protein
MASSRFERLSDLDRMLGELEQRLSRLSRVASRASASAPDTAGRIGDTIASALAIMAERFRGRASTLGHDVSEFSDDALRAGNAALRKLTRDVDHRPLVLVAVAAGVGLLAAGLLMRRS